ncbi:hypothetical protein CW749_12090 [Vibrio sp. vnigr-6D03]|uniref:PKD domain-containing protein n=1 Tax=Vibrio sp. vnigr-6D03 TaxID=2058088 RepID=UPI000C321D11|nr:hypothetical protein [Vibrio sp. vnigr-6D03]PKF79174.1 hypothetical protein CW749_12090 [Vibrio sp. vnigr-6D03]
MFKWLKLAAPALMVALVGCSVDTDEAKKLTKPTVNAGNDQVHTLPVSSIALNGTASTSPSVYDIETVSWTQRSGPQQLSILNTDKLKASIINPTLAGTYEFQLYVRDSGDRSNTDTVRLILNAANTGASASAAIRHYSDQTTQKQQTQSIQKTIQIPVSVVSTELTSSNGVIQYGTMDTTPSSDIQKQTENALQQLSDAATVTFDFSEVSKDNNSQLLIAMIESLRGDNAAQIVSSYDSENPVTTIYLQDLKPHQNMKFDNSELGTQLNELVDTLQLTIPSTSIRKN